MSYIINAAPMVIDQGIRDLSTRRVPREPEAIPQHCPKFYIFAQKGPLTPQLVSGAEMTNMYGIDSFDARKQYFNYTTQFVTAVNAKGNMMMIQRVLPEDAGPNANIILYADVLPTTVDVYERSVDGSIKLDSLGNPIVTGTTPGYKVKYIKRHHTTVSALQNDFARATILPGSQTDTTTSVQSQRYPILELKCGYQGSYGNNLGIRIWAPNAETSGSFPLSLLQKRKTFPYFLSVIERSNPDTAPKAKDTLFGEKFISFVLKENTIDPLTDARMYLGDKFINAYENITDLRYPAVYADFGTVAIYQNNIDHLLGLFHTAELPFITGEYDFTSDPEDKYAFNILSMQTSKGVLYHAVQIVDDVDSIRLSEYSNVFADGGSDGTLDNAHYCAQVIDQVSRYSDKMDELMDLPVHVESIMYDTGFPLEVKLKLAYFISQRKDTMVALGTHDVEDRTLTASEEHSIAIALRTRLRLFPESEYWGTPVTRAIIIGRSGLVRNSQYNKRLPLTYELAVKAARYMGAGNGRWKNGAHFDGAPGSKVEEMFDINIKWVPTSVRNRNWDVGLNWVQAYNRKEFFFPAWKTIYEDDTSVLNSFITAMACCYLNKVAHATWREFSGVSYLTNVQFLEKVNAFVTKMVEGRFDNRFVVQPAAYIDEYDALRGYSWHLPIKIYSANMKTVMVANTTAFRLDSDEPVYTSDINN